MGGEIPPGGAQLAGLAIAEPFRTFKRQIYALGAQKLDAFLIFWRVRSAHKCKRSFARSIALLSSWTAWA